MSSGPPSKFALETFLTGVNSKDAKFEGKFGSSSGSAAPSQDSEVAEAWRAVVLTILNQNELPVEEQDLLAYSELPPDKFQQTLEQLQVGGFVVASGNGYKLTEAGQLEARKRRSRLLRSM